MHSIEYWKKRIEEEKVKLGQLLEKKAIIKEDYSTDNNSELRILGIEIRNQKDIIRKLYIKMADEYNVDALCRSGSYLCDNDHYERELFTKGYIIGIKL